MYILYLLTIAISSGVVFFRIGVRTSHSNRNFHYLKPQNIRWTQNQQGQTFITKDFVLTRGTADAALIFLECVHYVLIALFIGALTKWSLEEVNVLWPVLSLALGIILGFISGRITVKKMEDFKDSVSLIAEYPQQGTVTDGNEVEYPNSGYMIAPREAGQAQTVHFLIEGQFASPTPA